MNVYVQPGKIDFEISSEMKLRVMKEGVVITDLLQNKELAIFPSEIDNVIEALIKSKEFLSENK